MLGWLAWTGNRVKLKTNEALFDRPGICGVTNHHQVPPTSSQSQSNVNTTQYKTILQNIALIVEFRVITLMFGGCILLKGQNIFCPVGHNIWWENWWNGSFKPKMVQICELWIFWVLKILTLSPGKGVEIPPRYPPFNSTLEMALQLTVDCRLTHSDLQ